MKREFLKSTIPGITDDQIDAIMAENGRDIEAGNKARESLAAKDQEINGLKGQITQLSGNIDELKKSAGDNQALQDQISKMQADHKTEVDRLNKQLSDQAYDHAADGFFADVKFKSSFARTAILADFKSKGYKLQDGKFIGAEGYIDSVKKADPNAFADDDKKVEVQQKKQPPTFTRQMNSQPTSSGSETPLQGLFFQKVRNFGEEK